MPNWVKNVINIEGPAEDVAKAIELMRDENPECENSIDFNNVIPMPERLKLPSGGYDRHYVALYLKSLRAKERGELAAQLSDVPVSFYGSYLQKYVESFTMDIPVDFLKRMKEHLERDYSHIHLSSMEDVGKTYIDNILEYGADTWYDWCRDHWGTKWNATECMITDDGFEFDTAWSAPFPIIMELSLRFPELIFCHKWADENLGWNCGKREFRNGLVAEEQFESEEDAYNFACAMWGYEDE
jgi:hypothetical protein